MLREEFAEAKEDLKKAFPVGAEVRVLVLPADDRGRMRLSQRALAEARERADASSFLEQQRGRSGLGTFADLLKKASEKPPK